MTSLKLTGNRITDFGAETLAYALMHNMSVTHIDVRSNLVSNVGAATLASVQSFKWH